MALQSPKVQITSTRPALHVFSCLLHEPRCLALRRPSTQWQAGLLCPKPRISSALADTSSLLIEETPPQCFRCSCPLAGLVCRSCRQGAVCECFECQSDISGEKEPGSQGLAAPSLREEQRTCKDFRWPWKVQRKCSRSFHVTELSKVS